MVKVLTLVWTLILALIVTAISFFYVSGENRGFPFNFSREVVNGSGAGSLQISYVSVILDILFWWFVFSILMLVIRNYIFEI